MLYGIILGGADTDKGRSLHTFLEGCINAAPINGNLAVEALHLTEVYDASTDTTLNRIHSDVTGVIFVTAANDVRHYLLRGLAARLAEESPRRLSTVPIGIIIDGDETQPNRFLAKQALIKCSKAGMDILPATFGHVGGAMLVGDLFKKLTRKAA